MQHPATGERWWFVYYRVRASELAAAVQAARAAQRSLADTHRGVSASLMQRPQPDADGLMTVMETYRAAPGLPEDQLRALADAIELTAAAAIAPWLQGTRHDELFEPCA